MKISPALTKLLATGFVFGAVAALAACTPDPVIEEEATAVQGNAQPAVSPAVGTGDNAPAGEVFELPGYLTDVEDLESVGDIIAVRSGTTLSVGAASEVAEGSGVLVGGEGGIDTQCGDLNAAAGHFYLGCGDYVLDIDPQDPANPQRIEVDTDFPVTSATRLSSGELFVASNEQAEVAIYKDGARVDDFAVGAPTDQLLTVPNRDGVDNVVRTWGKDTTIQSLDWENSRQGGRLRVGVALGQADVGEDGTIVVSDTGGGRVAIYTSEDVVRLHQFGNTAGTPWGVDWDDERQLAWVTSTDKNLAQAFAISSGVPEEAIALPTIPGAQFVSALADGSLVIASATGDGLQFVPSSDPVLAAWKEGN